MASATLFLTTPDPPKMLTPAANDHATSTMYTGMRAIMNSPTALSSDAMTRGKIVYPKIETDCMKELDIVSKGLFRLNGLISHIASQ